MANVLNIDSARRETDIRFPGADFKGGAFPFNPHQIVGSVTHAASAVGRFTITDAGTTGVTIDQLLHKVTTICGFLASGGAQYRVDKADITVDEANDRVAWTRSDNGAGLELVLLSSHPENNGDLGCLAGYAAAGS